MKFINLLISRPGLCYLDEAGYLRFSDSGILVHRWMAAKKLGRSLKKGEVVHHVNRNKLDNSPNNLWVCRNQNAHNRIHFIDAMRFGWKASYCGFNH